MLAMGIRQGQAGKLQEQEQTQQQALMKALSGERTQDFEQIAGGPPALESQSYTPRDPAKKHQQALSNLLGGDFSPDQMAGGMQIIEGMRQLNDPTQFGQQKELQQNEFGQRNLEREDTQDYQTLEREARQEFEAREARRARGDNAALQISIQDIAAGDRKELLKLEYDLKSKAALEQIEAEAKLKGLDLTEAQAKAVSWLGKGLGGKRVIDGMLQSGYKPSSAAVAAYEKSIDEETGAIHANVWRNSPALSQQDKNYLDAAYLFLDGSIRQATGVAVKQFEWRSMFYALIPRSEDPEELRNKMAAQQTILGTMAIAAGPGAQAAYDLVDETYAGVGTFNRNSTGGFSGSTVDAVNQLLLDAEERQKQGNGM
jgi:hypothetical protein